jgi:polyisoprenoid-binding protein YceI
MKEKVMKRVLAILAGLVIAADASATDKVCVVPGRGHFRIHVDSAGLFGAFGHNHLVEAQTITGCATVNTENISGSSIKLDFPTASLRVLDPNESAKDRADVQKTMETEVLQVSQYPLVTFETTAVEGSGVSNQFRLRGNLTIRGRSQPAIIPVTLTRLDDGTYRAVGEYKFKQSMFGIKPIKLAGGAVKVKDELSTEFELFLK